MPEIPSRLGRRETPGGSNHKSIDSESSTTTTGEFRKALSWSVTTGEFRKGLSWSVNTTGEYREAFSWLAGE